MKSFRTPFGWLDIWQDRKHDGCETIVLIVLIMIIGIIMGVITDCSNPYVGWIQ